MVLLNILAYLFFRKKQSLKINKRQIVPIALLAILSMYLTNALEFYGLQYLSAAKTCFIYSLTPFFAAFFSYIHFKEKLNFKKWIGIIIGFIGIMPVFFIHTGSESLTKSFFIISWPELAVIGATLFSVYGWVLLRLLVKDNNISPLTANGWSMLLGGLLSIGHSYLIDTWAPIPVAPGGILGFSQGVFLITFISNVLCYNLYGFLLKKYTATFMSFVGLLSPVFASLSEWILLKTAPNPVILLSTGVVLFGLWIIYREELKQGYIVKSKLSQTIADKQAS